MTVEAGAEQLDTDQVDDSAVDQDHAADEGGVDDQVEPDADDQDPDEGGRRPNREAALRRRAQAAEAERDQLRTQLGTLQRQIVGGVATAHGLPEVELLESAGHDIAAFIGEDGQVDVAAVIEATTATMDRYGITKRRPPAPNQQQGTYGPVAKESGVKATINKALGRDK